MLTAVDNILAPIFWGIGISLFFTGLMYLLALVFEIQMSAKSAGYAIVLFVVMLWQSSKLSSAMYVKGYVNEVENLVEKQIPGGMDSVSAIDFRQYLVQLHPSFQTLLAEDGNELPQDVQGKAYANELHSYLNKYIVERVCYFVAALIVFGILSFLFANRRMKYGERKRIRQAGRVVSTRRQRNIRTKNK